MEWSGVEWEGEIFYLVRVEYRPFNRLVVGVGRSQEKDRGRQYGCQSQGEGEWEDVPRVRPRPWQTRGSDLVFDHMH